MEKMSFGDNEFDVVISNGAFCLAPNKKAAFSEIFRVLKPGGILCFNDSIQADDRKGASLESLRGFPDNYHEPYYLDYI